MQDINNLYVLLVFLDVKKLKNHDIMHFYHLSEYYGL